MKNTIKLIGSAAFIALCLCSCNPIKIEDLPVANGKKVEDYDTSNNVDILSFGSVKLSNLEIIVIQAHQVTKPPVTTLELITDDSNVTSYDIVEAFYANPDGSFRSDLMSSPFTLNVNERVSLPGFDKTTRDYQYINYDNAVFRLITEDANISILLHKPDYTDASEYYNNDLSKSLSDEIGIVGDNATSYENDFFKIGYERIESVYFNNRLFFTLDFNVSGKSFEGLDILDIVLSFTGNEENVSLIDKPLTLKNTSYSNFRFMVKDTDASKYINASGDAYLTVYTNKINLQFVIPKK